MEMRINERIICCVIAAILFFMGMGLESTTAQSSFSAVSETGFDTLRPVSYIAEVEESCTLNMLHKSNSVVVRGNLENPVNRWSNKAAYVCLMVGAFLQDLFYYQSTESREDGRLFLCRSVAVDYIHLKDSGE